MTVEIEHTVSRTLDAHEVWAVVVSRPEHAFILIGEYETLPAARRMATQVRAALRSLDRLGTALQKEICWALLTELNAA